MRRTWTDDEEDVIRKLYGKRARIRRAVRWRKILAALPGRTKHAIRQHARKMGITAGGTRWGERENALIRTKWQEFERRSVMNKLPGRSWEAITRHALEAFGMGTIPQGYVTAAEASRRSGYEHSQVLAICERFGIPVSTHTKNCSTKISNWKLICWADFEQAVCEFVAQESIAVAARRLGVNAKVLRDWLIADGHHTPAKHSKGGARRKRDDPGPRRQFRAAPEFFDAVAERHNWNPRGESIEVAARRLGLAKDTLRKAVRAVPELSAKITTGIPARLDPAVYDEIARGLKVRARSKRPTLVRAAGTTCRDGRAEVPAAPTSTGTSPELERRSA